MQTEAFIAETANVAGGYPCVGDTRVRVGLVIEAYNANNGDDWRTAELFDLTVDQVRAAVDYYERHRARVDEDIRRNRRPPAH